jgi:hypothetical protein
MRAHAIVGADAKMPGDASAGEGPVRMAEACASDRGRGERSRETLGTLEDHGRAMGSCRAASPVAAIPALSSAEAG